MEGRIHDEICFLIFVWEKCGATSEENLNLECVALLLRKTTDCHKWTGTERELMEADW